MESLLYNGCGIRASCVAQALVKIKAKHNQENFTLSLPEYEEILDALVGSHYSTVPDHLSHESHHELGALLMQVRADLGVGLLSLESIGQALGSSLVLHRLEACTASAS